MKRAAATPCFTSCTAYFNSLGRVTTFPRSLSSGFAISWPAWERMPVSGLLPRQGNQLQAS